MIKRKQLIKAMPAVVVFGGMLISSQTAFSQTIQAETLSTERRQITNELLLKSLTLNTPHSATGVSESLLVDVTEEVVLSECNGSGCANTTLVQAEEVVKSVEFSIPIAHLSSSTATKSVLLRLNNSDKIEAVNVVVQNGEQRAPFTLNSIHSALTRFCAVSDSVEWQEGIQPGASCLLLDTQIQDQSGNLKINLTLQRSEQPAKSTQHRLLARFGATAEFTPEVSSELAVREQELIFAESEMGQVDVLQDNSIVYLQNNPEVTSDTIYLVYKDQQNNISNSTVSVTVSSNSPPVTNDDYASNTDGTFSYIEVVGNDVDPDGDELSLVGASAEFGRAAVNPNTDKIISYAPANGFEGVDTVVYVVTDGQAEAEGNLYVTVTPKVETSTTTDSANNTSQSQQIDSGSGGGALFCIALLSLMVLIRRNVKVSSSTV